MIPASYNLTILADVFAKVARPSWAASCLDLLNNISFADVTLVDGSGGIVHNLTSETWGISVGTCYDQCNAKANPFVSAAESSLKFWKSFD